MSNDITAFVKQDSSKHRLYQKIEFSKSINMSENGRFCVQFSATDIDSVTKTRILYKESKPNDIRDIWSQICNSEPPDDIQLIVGNHASYNLNDEKDFSVVMAMAEDQYRTQPSNPLHITLCGPREYKPNTPPSSNPSPEQPQASSADAIKDFQEDQKSEEENQIHSNVQSSSGDPLIQKIDPNSFEEDAVVHDLSIKKKMNSGPQRKIQSFVPRTYTPPNETPSTYPTQRDLFSNLTERCRDYRNTLQIYAQMRENMELPFHNVNKEKLASPQSSSHTLPVSAVSEAGALASSAQQQRFLQASSNISPFLLQSFRSSYDRYATTNWLRQLAQPTLNNHSGFPENLMDIKYFFERERDNFSGVHLPHHKNKRKSNILDMDSKKDRSTGKRMRSSSSQSNIEFHCEQAEKYMNLPAPLQKEHNSAHRSHWKHLSHVLSIWPQFATLYKHKKYDEWSSEARDIYAISLPEEYKWSFLTLAKQGDQLCKRIKRRVEDMQRMALDQRPQWCPSDETLRITWSKADERLQQLERIRNARHTTPSSSGSSKTMHHPFSAAHDRFTFSSQQNQQLVNQASNLRRNVFNDGAFDLMDQQAILAGRYKPMNCHQPYVSPGRPTPAETSYLGDVPSMSSPPERNLKFDASENALNSVEKNGFFLQRMKKLTANFHDCNYSSPSIAAIEDEPTDGSELNQTKPSQIHQTTSVSPTSPRHTGTGQGACL